MNKTLLLIICDFLLLNLLALTRWEKAEPPRLTQAPVPELAANAVTKDQDLVETMRQSLADESTQRNQLAQKLAANDAALAAREQSLTAALAEKNALATEKSTLASSLTESQRSLADLGKRVAAATQEVTMTKEQLAQLHRDLADKQAEADRNRSALAARQKDLEDANKKINGLYTMVAVAEEQKKNFENSAKELQVQVQTERQERAKVQETATQLAQGVGQLAEKSGELTTEIRSNRPINANVIFNDFLANRVSTTFSATRKGIFSPNVRTKEAPTVLITDGRQIYALLHVADTVFSLSEVGDNWEKFAIEFARPPFYRSAAANLQFLAHDPRVLVIPVEASQAAALGAKVYPLASEPFKFPEAVLISASGKGYGEVGFKLDASEPNFVRVDNRFFKRLFGDFAPSRGDLVFSKTGELLGIMVNSDYCALLKDFTPVRTLRTGNDILAQQTGALLDDLGNRVRSLPQKLQ